MRSEFYINGTKSGPTVRDEKMKRISWQPARTFQPSFFQFAKKKVKV